MSLRVLEIFDSIQGEGHWTGTPMTFVRLAGCNAPGLDLGCTEWCDTRESWYTDGGEELGVADIILQVGLPHVCVTGGEPLLQRTEVARFASEARGLGMRVHLETNGTVDAPLPGKGSPDGRVFDWVTLSPKPPRYSIARGWLGLVDELKVVVDEGLTASTVERLAADFPAAAVCIQPVWGRPGAAWAGREAPLPDRDSVERAIALVMDHPEWRLSLQMHKFLGIR